MHLAFILILLQAPTTTASSLTKPQTHSLNEPKPESARSNLQVGQQTSSTSGLTVDSALNIGVQLGSQGESMGEIKEKVSQLERQRDAVDRPDINMLKASRVHVIYIVGILGGVAGFIWLIRKPLWKSLAIPYLRKELQPPFNNSD
jgi:hypothetical protein